LNTQGPKKNERFFEIILAGSKGAKGRKKVNCRGESHTDATDSRKNGGEVEGFIKLGDRKKTRQKGPRVGGSERGVAMGQMVFKEAHLLVTAIGGGGAEEGRTWRKPEGNLYTGKRSGDTRLRTGGRVVRISPQTVLMPNQGEKDGGKSYPQVKEGQKGNFTRWEGDWGIREHLLKHQSR